MLIVSNFHDYYDTALTFGVDKSVVYSRKTTDIKNPPIKGQVPSPYNEEFKMVRQQGGGTYTYTIDKKAIGFCGKIYPTMKVKKEDCYYPANNEVFVFYEADSMVEFLKKERLGLQHQKYRFRYRSYSVDDERDVQEFFDKTQWRGIEDKFQEHKCPIFIYGSEFEGNPKYTTILRLNPNLKHYRFAKVKDPVTAFQEIYMFISGVLGTPARPMVEVSDKVKAASRGHDGEYSFKKPPGGGQWR